MLEVLAEALGTTGYRVIAARSGLEALRLWAAEPSGVDLLITDVMMPIMDGRELARACRERDPALKVLFLTGSYAVHVAEDEHTACRRKPVFFDDLMAVVESLLGRR